MKASFGRVPLYPGCRDPRFPGMSSWESLEHIGPMTRTVQDSALLLSVIAGPDDRDRHSLPGRGTLTTSGALAAQYFAAYKRGPGSPSVRIGGL